MTTIERMEAWQWACVFAVSGLVWLGVVCLVGSVLAFVRSVRKARTARLETMRENARKAAAKDPDESEKAVPPGRSPVAIFQLHQSAQAVTGVIMATLVLTRGFYPTAAEVQDLYVGLWNRVWGNRAPGRDQTIADQRAFLRAAMEWSQRRLEKANAKEGGADAAV